MSATQRAAAMRWSPIRSTTTPVAIGSHTRAESNPKCMNERPPVVLSVRQEIAQEHRETDDHPEGVRVQITALNAPDETAEPADRGRRAVYQRAVDDRRVATAPEAAAQEARCAGDDV